MTWECGGCGGDDDVSIGDGVWQVVMTVMMA
jgi:hypothetical protein